MILSIVNRRRINQDYLKLEAKVDNTREGLEREVKEVLKVHENDAEEIRSLIVSALPGDQVNRRTFTGVILEIRAEGSISISITSMPVPAFNARSWKIFRLMGTVVR